MMDSPASHLERNEHICQSLVTLGPADYLRFLESVDVPSLRRAASCDRAYPAHSVTHDALVNRSGLSEEQKKFWLRLV